VSELWDGPVADAGDPLPSAGRTVPFEGRIWSVVSEDVDFGGTTARRDVLIHPGAVAVIALDDDDRVLLIRQYRHPVGRYLFEPPAGLMDALDESGWETAQRELAEEAGYEAGTWHVLLDVYLSPGGMSEAIRIFLARDLVERSGAFGALDLERDPRRIEKRGDAAGHGGEGTGESGGGKKLARAEFRRRAPHPGFFVFAAQTLNRRAARSRAPNRVRKRTDLR